MIRYIISQSQSLVFSRFQGINHEMTPFSRVFGQNRAFASFGAPSGAGPARSAAGARSSLHRIAELGIVGAGGGGFPTDVKLQTGAALLIANAAECEPLLHKDKELLHHHAEPFLGGMVTAM
jgi:hypothetical protein